MNLVPAPQTDVLGPGYEMIVLEMGADYEGRVVATLVRRRAESSSGRAVLYIHGYNDYFFQKHLADFYVSRGISFYALDLRKYGRSILPHQTPYLCQSLAEYMPDIDAAMSVVREDGHAEVILSGHSTGGLVASIWAAQASRDALTGLVLNSPYLSSGIPGPARWMMDPVLRVIARRNPQAAFPGMLSPRYTQSLHQDFAGEWEFDTRWKSVAGTRLRLAWLAGIHEAQRRVSQGLGIETPILVMCSTRSSGRRASIPELLAGDAVLNVEEIARLSIRLGRNVTLVRIPGAVHDVFLSGRDVRDHALHELARWLCQPE